MALIVSGMAVGCGSEPADGSASTTAEGGTSTDPVSPGAALRTALAVEFADDEWQRVLQHSPLAPAPADPTNRFAASDSAAALGRALFYDRGLSSDGSVGCVSCHLPEHALADGRALAQGVGPVRRNAPALWNVGHNRWFFWDGRADTLWAQALVPLEDPREHAFSRVGVVRHLQADAALRAAYEDVFGPLPELPPEPAHAAPFPDHVRHPFRLAWLDMEAGDREAVDAAFANVGKALAAFVTRFSSDAAPFDRFVASLRTGDREGLGALNASAQRGLKLFMGSGNCWVCHTGPNFTDREFHDIRVPARVGLPEDFGRLKGMQRLFASEFRSDGIHSDDAEDGEVKIGYLNRDGHFGWRQFKTPSLRNVSLTAPYMHQGQLATLEDVVRYYSTLEGAVESVHPEKILAPLDLDAGQQADLVAFLRSLEDADLPPGTGPPGTR